jgi:hypothetical protein
MARKSHRELCRCSYTYPFIHFGPRFPASQCVAKYQPRVPPFPFGIGPAGMVIFPLYFDALATVNHTTIAQPAAFHQKWIALSLQKDRNGDSIIELLDRPCTKLGENPNGGQLFNFLGGDIVSMDVNTPPVVCYRKFRGCVVFVCPVELRSVTFIPNPTHQTLGKCWWRNRRVGPSSHRPSGDRRGSLPDLSWRSYP